MLDYLKNLKDDPNGPFDVIYFLPGEQDGQLHLEGRMFTDPGTKVGGNAMGDCYTVVLFKEDIENDTFCDFDQFDAILTDPYEYMSGLIPEDWYGIFTKKTTNSDDFIQNLLAKLKEI
jgi:hypothetical protein